jgi:hypothetical protein
MEASGSNQLSPSLLALIDHELVVSLIRTASDTLLTLSPLAVVVLILLVPYVYRILFLRSRVDRRSFQQTRSRTAPIVRRMRKRLDFDARHWANYVAKPGRNLNYRIETSLFYDLAKAAAAYHASGQWDDHMRQHGIVQPEFIDEEHSLLENLEKNGFFESSFFAEGVADRYLMGRTNKGYGPLLVQTDPALRARATALFKEALAEIEPQYEEGHIYLPFLKLSRWERVRFRIHTLIITKLLSDGVERAMALAMSYGLVHLLKGESVSRGAVDFIMDMVALLFMTHLFDIVLTKRYSGFKSAWEDQERFYYRRQIHQFLIGLDEEDARAERAREKQGLARLILSGSDRGLIKRVFKAVRKNCRDPRKPGRLLTAAEDVLEYSQEDSTPVALVLLKEFAVAHRSAYEQLIKKTRRGRRRLQELDALVRVLLNDEACIAVANRKKVMLPEEGNSQEWQRAIQSLHRDSPEEIDQLKTELLMAELASSKFTPAQRRNLILTHYLGGLLWRLRQIDDTDPLGRRKDARIYHGTLTYSIPALKGLLARRQSEEFDCGLKPAEMGRLITQIQKAIPLPPGHLLRQRMSGVPQIVTALEEIQELVEIKKSPARSTAPELETSQLRSWLDSSAQDQPALSVLAHAIHEAYRSVLATRVESHAKSVAGDLVIDPRVFDPHFNPHGAEALQGLLARNSLDGNPSEAVLTFLGCLGTGAMAAAAMPQAPPRLTFLDLQPIVDYVSNTNEDPEILEELTHQALVEFYLEAHRAKRVQDLSDALIRPSEGEDTGGLIARQMAIIRLLKAKISTDQGSTFLLLQEAVNELEVVVNPMHADLDFLLRQAARVNPKQFEAARESLFRLQDAGRSLLVPLSCMADDKGVFEHGLDAYWSDFEPATEKEKFLRQFDINGREHADAIIRARILLHQYDALRAMMPVSGERGAYASYDSVAGDTVLLKISAAIIMAMIEQCGLRTEIRFSAVHRVLSEALARQGFCKRGNLSDLVRVTLKERDEFGNTLFMRRPGAGSAGGQRLQPVFPIPSDPDE